LTLIIYSLFIFLARWIYRVAGLFNTKAQLFVDGRKSLFKKINAAIGENKNKLVWVHCASLGEFEQGRPIIESLKKQHSSIKILLTFFSPSGYEVRKNYTHADYVCYLPWDTASNAKEFVDITRPALAIFIKYEFWHHYTLELKKKNIPIVSASSIFRDDQIYFKWYGSFSRNILKNFSHFFVQSPHSIELLNRIGITQVTLAGDTRFDRVYEITQQSTEIEIAQRFKGGEKTFVIGSFWPEDLEVLAPFINEHRHSLKFILAPHEISEKFLGQIEQLLSVKTIRYSMVPANENLETYSVLIIDNIGMLSTLYRYGEFAYVGGAFGKGLHNILEAACYGIPIFFGDQNYQKFQEARELIMRGGAFAINSYTDLKKSFELLINKPESFLLACEVTRSYVKENLGATAKITSYCTKILLP
jgi:3-deoxy-D-manno-octulosonic-acid transferase